MTRKNINLISYCNGRYPENFGGVARFDYHLSLAFPTRKWFKGPHQLEEMVAYAGNVKNPVIITDNHLACDIPNKFPVVLVHHGVARTHAERDPFWNDYWKNLCVNGQDKMLKHRSAETTLILAVSQFCIDEINKHYPDDYSKYEKKILHNSTELSPDLYKNSYSKKPVVLGNWPDYNKGANIVHELTQKLDAEFIFKQLYVPKLPSIDEHNKIKEQAYLDADIFLGLSLSEGYSYAMADALQKNLLIASTDVGLGYDMPSDIFVVIDWKKRDDIDYVSDRLMCLWENREFYNLKAKNWFDQQGSLDNWKKEMRDLVHEFYNVQYG